MIGELKKKAKLSKEDAKAAVFLENTLVSLTQLYLVHRASIELEYVELPKLLMSEADRLFF